jgi:uncharacterized membrane protein
METREVIDVDIAYDTYPDKYYVPEEVSIDMADDGSRTSHPITMYS